MVSTDRCACSKSGCRRRKSVNVFMNSAYPVCRQDRLFYDIYTGKKGWMYMERRRIRIVDIGGMIKWKKEAGNPG